MIKHHRKKSTQYNAVQHNTIWYNAIQTQHSEIYHNFKKKQSLKQKKSAPKKYNRE